MVDIVQLLQEAKQQERGPYYTCDCEDRLDRSSVLPHCPSCGQASAMEEGLVYIEIKTSWNCNYDTYKVPITEFIAQVLALVDEAVKEQEK